LKQKTVANGRPSNLAQLKRHLAVGREITVVMFDSNGAEIKRRDTAVKSQQANSVIVDRDGGNSWLEFGKADGWTYDDNGATRHFIGRDGNYYPSIRVEYKN
jgi:hypothetical protein